MTHRAIGDATRVIRAPRGNRLTCRSWLTEAAFRMIQNNLDPEVAENPAELVVYGGIGRAARNWECYDAILAALRRLGDDESLLVQSQQQEITDLTKDALTIERQRSDVVQADLVKVVRELTDALHDSRPAGT